ncbi:hypothetical protein H1R20_g8314, partial [Candolleomyces eurysporus]
MGANRWGPVVLPVANNNAKLIEEYVAAACGSSVSSIAAQTSAVSTSAAVTSTSVAPQTSSTTVPTTTSVQTSQTTTVSSTTSVSSSSAANLAPTTQDAPATTTSSSSTRVVTTTPPATTSRVVTTAAPVTTPPRPTTTAAPPPSTTAASNGGSTGSGSTSGGDIADYLAGHNTIRRNHGASDLTWSDELASAAQRWANNCEWKHSGGAVGPFGENLAAGTNLGIRAAIKLWTDEVSEYNPANPKFSHFTQVVWKGTTQVGCAVQTCTGILGNSPAKFYVCEYNPPGNVAGRFGENVQV